MRSVILERNKLVGRKVARLFMATGATAVSVEEPGQVAAALEEAATDLLCADTFDGDLVAELVRQRPGLRGVLWTAEPLRRSLRHMIETRRIDHVLGRRDFETPPRAWELTMLARRLQSNAAPPLAAYLDWGFSAADIAVRSTADRDAAATQIQDFVARLHVPNRVAEMFSELGHEL